MRPSMWSGRCAEGASRVSEAPHQRRRCQVPTAPPLHLNQRRPVRRPARAYNGVARTDDNIRVRVDRPGARLELAREAIVQTREALFLGLVQLEIRKRAPNAYREIPHERLLDLAEPAHESRQQPPRDAIRQQEVKVLLAEYRHEHRANRHAAVKIIAYICCPWNSPTSG